MVHDSRAQKREQVLAAAREVFISAGYAGASLDAIAERSGHSRSAVHASFASKEAVFLELLAVKLDTDIADLHELVDAAASPEALLASVRERLESRGDILDFTLVAVEFLGQLEDDSPSAQACADLYRRQRRGFAELLRALPQWSHEPDFADDAAAGLVAMTLGLAVQRGMDRKLISPRVWARAVSGYLAALMGVTVGPGP
jgi:AcrR family transcriptional regulator